MTALGSESGLILDCILDILYLANNSVILGELIVCDVNKFFKTNFINELISDTTLTLPTWIIELKSNKKYPIFMRSLKSFLIELDVISVLTNVEKNSKTPI